MTPARDRLARILMITLGIASVGAFATPALTFESFAPERVNVETWRMFGYLVFAGLFTLLGLFPRRMTGVWELVLFTRRASRCSWPTSSKRTPPQTCLSSTAPTASFWSIRCSQARRSFATC